MKHSKYWIGAGVLSLSVLSACGSGGGDSSSGDGGGGEEGSYEPDSSLEIVAPAGAGGGWDTVARSAAEGLEKEGIVDQGIGVVNREGGGGANGWSYIHNQAGNPEYSFVASPPLLLVPLNGQSEYSYEDFTPLSNMIADYGAFAVTEDAKWDDLNELFEDMKENPDDITVVGESSPGSMDHMQFAKIAAGAGVDPSTIKYVSAQDGSALTNLLNGQADVYSTGITETVEQVRAGDVKVLGITAEERLEGDTVSEFPTATEQGIEETFVNWRGFLGPPDMSDAEIAYYEETFKELSESEYWQETRQSYAWEENYMDSEEFEEFLAEEEKSMQDLLDEVGIDRGGE